MSISNRLPIQSRRGQPLYENIPVTQTPTQLAEKIGTGFGWPMSKESNEISQIWYQPRVMPKKHALRPSIQARHEELRVHGADWYVCWYMHDGFLDGVHIVGHPDSSFLAQVFVYSESPGLQLGYEAEDVFLHDRPMYRNFLPGPKSTKREDPRGYMGA